MQCGLLDGILDLLCPRRCLLCGVLIEPEAPAGVIRDFCPACTDGLPRLPAGYCSRCGQPFESPVSSVHTCPACLKDSPSFDRALAAGIYEDGLRKAVHYLKYGGRTELAAPLAAFMSSCLTPPFYPPECDLILPVPLHSRRIRKRGFNQALVLTEKLFRPWRDKIRFDILLRTRWTRPQVELDGEARRRNVRGAFSVALPDAVAGRSVMVFDDVYTTGATVEACAGALKKSGARHVLVLTLARVR